MIVQVVKYAVSCVSMLALAYGFSAGLS